MVFRELSIFEAKARALNLSLQGVGIFILGIIIYFVSQHAISFLFIFIGAIMGIINFLNFLRLRNRFS